MCWHIFRSHAVYTAKLQKLSKTCKKLSRRAAEFAYVNYFSYLCIAFPPIGVLRLMQTHYKIAIALVIYAAAVICAACRVTRTTTTTSSCVHQGDTAVVIQSQTTEVYDAQSHSK